jgi:uncharacterized glyoxalase superfamily protein PhnB
MPSFAYSRQAQQSAQKQRAKLSCQSTSEGRGVLLKTAFDRFSFSVLDYVRRFKLMPLKPTNESIHSGYSNWRCKKWETTVKHGEMTILQVPHMTYWGGCIENDRSREAVAWVVHRSDQKGSPESRR